MRAIVLAAGEGTRMWPLATDQPKHLLPVAGTSLIGHLLRTLSTCGLKDIVLVVGYGGKEFRSHVRDGSKYGVNVEYAEQPKRTGTATAVKAAEELVKGGQFLAMYGDLLLSVSGLRKIVEAGQSSSKVMGVVRTANPTEYGLVEVKEDQVNDIQEKPRRAPPSTGFVNAGVYLLDDDVFHDIKKTKRSERQEYELTSSVLSMIKRGNSVRAVELQGEEWMDVGRPWDLLEANRRALNQIDGAVNGRVEDLTTLRGSVYVEEDATVFSGSHIEGPVYIGRGATVGPNARLRPHTSIEAEAHVGTSCEIKNSLVMGGSGIPHLSYVGDSIIGRDCNLGAGTVTANIRFDEANIRIRVKGVARDTGRRKLGAIIGDRVQTGINVSIMPGVRIGPDSRIGPGTIVYKDVPSNARMLVKQNSILRVPKNR